MCLSCRNINGLKVGKDPVLGIFKIIITTFCTAGRRTIENVPPEGLLKNKKASVLDFALSLSKAFRSR